MEELRAIANRMATTTVARDELGFEIVAAGGGTGERYERLMESCRECDASWRAFRDKKCRGERCLIRTRALVSQVTKHGLDESDRARCWYTWSGAPIERKKSKRTYEQLCELPLSDLPGGPKDAKQVDLDLPRTFPEHPEFSGLDEEGEGRERLRRILLAASHHTGYAYLQGMNFLAGFLLLVLESEQEAFWVFACLLRSLHKYFGRPNLVGLKEDLNAVSRAVSEREELRKHLRDQGVEDFSLCLPKWLLCGFVLVLETPLLLRAWDAFWVQRGDRGKYLRKVAAFLLLSNEEELLRAEGLGEVYAVLSRGCGRNVSDASEFLLGVESTRVEAALAEEKGEEGRSREGNEEGRKRKVAGGQEGAGEARSAKEAKPELVPMTPVSRALQDWIQSGTPLMGLRTTKAPRARAGEDGKGTARRRRNLSLSLSRRKRGTPASGRRTPMADMDHNSIEMKAIVRRLEL